MGTQTWSVGLLLDNVFFITNKSKAWHGDQIAVAAATSLTACTPFLSIHRWKRFHFILMSSFVAHNNCSAQHLNDRAVK